MILSPAEIEFHKNGAARQKHILKIVGSRPGFSFP